MRRALGRGQISENCLSYMTSKLIVQCFCGWSSCPTYFISPFLKSPLTLKFLSTALLTTLLTIIFRITKLDIVVISVLQMSSALSISLNFTYQDTPGCEGCKVSRFTISRMTRFRGLQRLQDFRLYNFQDIKVAKVAKVAKFQTLSLSGYQSYEGCKGCKVSDFIILWISGLPGWQRLQSSDFIIFRILRLRRWQGLQSF